MGLSLWPQVRVKELLKFLMPTHKNNGALVSSSRNITAVDKVMMWYGWYFSCFQNFIFAIGEDLFLEQKNSLVSLRGSRT
jgi:hypothetical protein